MFFSIKSTKFTKSWICILKTERIVILSTLKTRLSISQTKKRNQSFIISKTLSIRYNIWNTLCTTFKNRTFCKIYILSLMRSKLSFTLNVNITIIIIIFPLSSTYFDYKVFNIFKIFYWYLRYRHRNFIYLYYFLYIYFLVLFSYFLLPFLKI